jgi:hypothetical protein
MDWIGIDWVGLIALAAILVPLYFLAHVERTRLSDPRYVRTSGVAVERAAVRIHEGAEVIGYYDGCEISASVEYLGLRYRFESVVPASYSRRLRPGELYVEPGLLYVAEPE